jgi:hypothetical protein
MIKQGKRRRTVDDEKQNNKTKTQTLLVLPLAALHRSLFRGGLSIDRLIQHEVFG